MEFEVPKRSSPIITHLICSARSEYTSSVETFVRMPATNQLSRNIIFETHTIFNKKKSIYFMAMRWWVIWSLAIVKDLWSDKYDLKEIE